MEGTSANEFSIFNQSETLYSESQFSNKFFVGIITNRSQFLSFSSFNHNFADTTKHIQTKTVETIFCVKLQLK